MLAQRCAGGGDIRLQTPLSRGWLSQRVGGERGVALAAIDLQPLFIDPASPWGDPRPGLGNDSFLAALPRLERLAAAVTAHSGPGGSPAGFLVFTRFIPADAPCQGQGAWPATTACALKVGRASGPAPEYACSAAGCPTLLPTAWVGASR